MARYVNMNKFTFPTGEQESSSVFSRIQNAGANMSYTTITIIFVTILFLGIGLYYYYYHFSPMVSTKYKSNSENVPSDNTGKYAELIMFYVDWCPHCKTAKPIWNDVKAQYENKMINGHQLIFKEINCTDESAEISEMMDKYNIEGFPTIKMLKDGQIIEFDAKPTKTNLEQFIKSVI
jgi:thiol-disulfide isomerase/thioredoxin